MPFIQPIPSSLPPSSLLPSSTPAQSVSEKINIIQEAERNNGNVFVDERGNLTRGSLFQHAVLWMKDKLPDALKKFFINQDAWESGRKTFKAQLNYRVANNLGETMQREAASFAVSERFKQELGQRVEGAVGERVLMPAQAGEKLSAQEVEQLYNELCDFPRNIPKEHRAQLLKNAEDINNPATKLGKAFYDELGATENPKMESKNYHLIETAYQLGGKFREEIEVIQKDIGELMPELNSARRQMENFRKENRFIYNKAMRAVEILRSDPENARDILLPTDKTAVKRFLPSLEKLESLEDRLDSHNENLALLQQGLEKTSQLLAKENLGSQLVINE